MSTTTRHVVRPTVAHLKEIRLLSCFKDHELERLLSLGQAYLYEPHSNIVIEGEQSWGLYVVLDGSVGVLKNNQLTGDSFDLAQIRSGGFFGEMSLIDDQPRSATVRTFTETQVFNLTKEAFLGFIGQSGELRTRFLESVVRNLVHRIRELDDNYVISQYQLWKTALKKGAA